LLEGGRRLLLLQGLVERQPLVAEEPQLPLWVLVEAVWVPQPPLVPESVPPRLLLGVPQNL
jgi:hypothetical protein